MNLRARIRSLRRKLDSRGVGLTPLPLVVDCPRGEDPDSFVERLCKERNAPHWSPLVIADGPEEVEPPADLPRQ